jgi:hypothetical protein
MAFSKSFPRHVEGSSYSKWEEISLNDEEERHIEDQARAENIEIFKECIDDAKQMIEEKGFKGFKEDTLRAAIPLFEKRASHAVFWKESRCKEIFDQSSK